MHWGLHRDATVLVAGQGVRALGYGFTAVLLGALLAARGYRPVQAGVLLSALIAGSAGSSLLLGAVADRVGRRRSYLLVFAGIAVAGVIVAAGAGYWLVLVVALTGTLSTDVVDNGPATTLEQVMLADDDRGTASVFARYNAAGAACGALGALAVVAVGLDRQGASAWPFALLVPVGLSGVALALALSPAE